MAKQSSNRKTNMKSQMKNTVKSIMAAQVVPKGVTTNHAVRWTVVVPVGAAPGDIGRALTFQLQDLPSVSEITALYDFYSINKVDVEWHLMFPSQETVTKLQTYPVITYAPDYDDGTAPTSRGEVMEYGKNCRVEHFSASKPVIRTSIIPRVSNTIFQTGLSSAYSLAAAGTLVDAANGSAPHYGLKWWTDTFNTTQLTGGNILIYLKYHITLVATR